MFSLFVFLLFLASLFLAIYGILWIALDWLLDVVVIAAALWFINSIVKDKK